MKRTRYRSRTASVALTLALLTTPATTLPLLYWADRSSVSLKHVAASMPYAEQLLLLALILIGLPLLALFLAVLALRSIQSSWSPVAGGFHARSALIIAALSSLAATVIFIAGIL